jgi:hypothetical protein
MRNRRTARARRVVVVALAVTALGGCRLTPDDGSAAEAAERFHAALQRGDGSAACRLLTPDTRSALEGSEGQPCPNAITAQDLRPASAAIKTDAYATNARVVMDGDVVFLAAFERQWLVVAAGCSPRQDEPYDCTVGGG